MNNHGTDGASWPNRLYALDVSRAVASLAVILFHWSHIAGQLASDPALRSRTSQPAYDWLKPFYESGYQGVGYFFLLSGFIFFWLYGRSIEQRQTGLLVFAIHRFSRLYPLHLVTLCLVAFMQWRYFSATEAFFVYRFNDFYHFALHMGFASAWGLQEGWSFNHPVWSVSIEVVLYGGFFFVMFWGLGRRWHCLLYSVIAFLLQPHFSNPVFYGITLFFLGGFIYQAVIPFIQKRKNRVLGLYAITCLFWTAVFIDFYGWEFSEYLRSSEVARNWILRGFSQYLLLPSTLMSLTLLEIRGSFPWKKIGWFGDITYATYLLHFPLMLLAGLAQTHGWLPENFYLRPTYIAAFFIILIPLSLLTYRHFERPVQRWIRKRLEPRQGKHY